MTITVQLRDENGKEGKYIANSHPVAVGDDFDIGEMELGDVVVFSPALSERQIKNIRDYPGQFLINRSTTSTGVWRIK